MNLIENKEWTREIRCPYCNKQRKQESFTDDPEGVSTNGFVECPHCHYHFHVQQRTVKQYKTQKINVEE